MREFIVYIVGPTSSGKSAVAVNLAKKINGEIISCDSMQIYENMDILTQPPNETLLSEVPHYLIKELSPEKEYDVATFVGKASELISSILSENKVPIVVGGTGLYFKSLVDGIFSSPDKDEKKRKELMDMVKEKGKEYLHDKLKEVDPETAKKLHVNDVKRIIRALEVFHLTGETIAEKKKEAEGISDKYDCRIFGLEMPRELLYSRIDECVDKMFEEGLVSEVEMLMDLKLSKTARKALGVKEISAMLNGDLELEEAKALLKKNTRNYAKRQLTWFRADKRIDWIDADQDVEGIVKEILNNL